MRIITTGIISFAALGLAVAGSISPAAASQSEPTLHRSVPGLQHASCGPRCERERRAAREREEHRRLEGRHY